VGVGKKGSKFGEFEGIFDIACDAADNVLVCDAGNRRVQIFRSDGSFLTSFTVDETPPFRRILRAIALGPDNRIYIAMGDTVEIYAHRGVAPPRDPNAVGSMCAYLVV
jgi:hypothetical protein